MTKLEPVRMYTIIVSTNPCVKKPYKLVCTSCDAVVGRYTTEAGADRAKETHEFLHHRKVGAG